MALLLSRFFLGVEPAFNADSPKGFHHVKKPLGGNPLKGVSTPEKKKNPERDYGKLKDILDNKQYCNIDEQ